MRLFRRKFSSLRVSDKVQAALHSGRPVVALESTIISHGMPFPYNLEVANAVEDIVWRAGAIPATIGVVHGIPTVGLSAAQLKTLAEPASDRHHVLKCSKRDLAYACAKNLHGATTVAATSYLASLTGIKTFATGGLGGVHYGAENTMDVSADLYELSRTGITVVCSGIKSILDIPKSLEVLESYGVPVITFRSNEFPAFFSNNSGLRAQYRVDTTKEVAAMMKMSDDLRINAGMILAVPNPSPADTESIQHAIAQALIIAKERGIEGSAITPFLLSYINTATEGKSLEANVNLVLNNARIAAEIAVDYALLGRSTDFTSRGEYQTFKSIPRSVPPVPQTVNNRPGVICFGGAVVDAVGSSVAPFILGSSNPGMLHISFGGVARNIAEGIARQGGEVLLVSSVGKDSSGHSLLQHAKSAGILIDGVAILEGGARTATYTALHNHDGEMIGGIADVSIIQETLTPAYMSAFLQQISTARVVVADGNLSIPSFQYLATACTDAKVPLVFDCTSDPKSILPILADSLHKVSILKANVGELRMLIGEALKQRLFTGDMLHAMVMAFEDRTLDQNSLCNMSVGLLWLMNRSQNSSDKSVFVSRGAKGIIWATMDRDGTAPLNYVIPATPVEASSIVNASGAGDSFVSGLVFGIMTKSPEDQLVSQSCIQRGLAMAVESLRSRDPVPQILDLSSDIFKYK